MDFIFANSPYVWIFLGITLLFSEFLLPGTFVMFLGIGAIFTGILARLLPIEFYTQVIVWVISSFVSILVGGTAVKRFFKSESSVDPFIQDDYLNQIVPVEIDILVERHGGKIRFQGTLWDAVSKDSKIPKGNYVRILSRENLTFTVERVES
ncbi:NfeD family protein [Leptospira sp. 2 VSF19]|uniref:NfeD family protein n=1 Tax=Leptospira soteropolitanensis TaxID=2950025 RepID=A0AAW5VI85_9LEPT|nr:NfeD family protein [Leptospira soteropolitanensis]MCW7492279.1 NfeD family protein [Leptospira soteropolitanensis]MCW7499861.1 NfeD family protein [Leptospira soteropolitanensis]MCW7522112.1 NfeD family protein [Leptospira soteropolitanensis]MCW7525966.1 NfeD family protein [Leptospira soteropolitanensis]MCW7529920.1 NfeD family protein [Leptospira soteropolitanensis]